MKDDVFGELKWTHLDCWEGQALFAQLAGYGAALEEEDPPREVAAPDADLGPTRRQVEAAEALKEFAKTLGGEEAEMLDAMLELARKPMEWPEAKDAKVHEAEEEVDPTKVEVMVDTGGRRKKPVKAQREAWGKLLARGEGLWDEILEKAVALYNRQRPVRLRAWKATYGEYALRRCLPEVKKPEEMKRLVRPLLCRVKQAEKGGAAEVGIHFAATWHTDGFGALVRDGRVADLGHIDLVHPLTKPRRPVIEHPVFGKLGRIPDEDVMEFVNQWKRPTEPGVSGFAGAKSGGPWPWEGLLRCDPFLEYCYVASDRADFVHQDQNAGRPQSKLAWEFAGGEFEVRVYAGRGQEPDEAQARAWEAFRAGERKYAAEMMGEVFTMYQEVCEIRRKNWLDKYVDDLIPILSGPEGLKDLVQLRCIHVHPADADGRVTIGFQFVCSWDYDGISALWREGKVREWGVWDNAKPAG